MPIDKIDFIPSFGAMDLDYDGVISETEFMRAVMRQYGIDANDLSSASNILGGYDLQDDARHVFSAINSNKFALRNELTREEAERDLGGITEAEMRDFFQNTRNPDDDKIFELYRSFKIAAELVQSYYDRRFDPNFYELSID